jgi:hypothetical protein
MNGGLETNSQIEALCRRNYQGALSLGQYNRAKQGENTRAIMPELSPESNNHEPIVGPMNYERLKEYFEEQWPFDLD